jgi:hypothetical protein
LSIKNGKDNCHVEDKKENNYKSIAMTILKSNGEKTEKVRIKRK